MKIDLHTHTRHSRDSVNSPGSVVRAAKRKGLDGVAITDHNSVGGWKEAREASRKHKFPVILGEEVKVLGGGEILGLFLSKGIRSRDPQEVIDEIKAQGGIAVVAHPFDGGRGFKDLENIAGLVHGLEVINSRVYRAGSNLKALRASAHYGLARTGGSDAHAGFEIGRACTVANANTLEGFRRALLKKQTWAVGKKSSVLVHGASILARVRKLGK
ncbi:MAG: PHP domain-containing protein [Candidatus Aenigmatarchaeota archaeon]